MPASPLRIKATVAATGVTPVKASIGSSTGITIAAADTPDPTQVARIN